MHAGQTVDLIPVYFHLQCTTICEVLLSFNHMQEDQIVDSLEEAAAAAAEQALDGGHEDNAPVVATSLLQSPAASARAQSDGPPDDHLSWASPCCAQPEPAPRDEDLLPSVLPHQVNSVSSHNQCKRVLIELEFPQHISIFVGACALPP